MIVAVSSRTQSHEQDEQIVAMLRDQPSEGVALLYDTYGRIVYSVAFRVVQDHGAAEEITQDVIMRCWRTIHTYQPGRSSLASWLLSIAHNRAIDELRSRRGKHTRSEMSGDILDVLADEANPLDNVLLRGTIRDELLSLPLAQREVVELVFWGDLTRREVAERLHVPLGTVHTRLRLGMEKLRQTLGHLIHNEQIEEAE